MENKGTIGIEAQFKRNCYVFKFQPDNWLDVAGGKPLCQSYNDSSRVVMYLHAFMSDNSRWWKQKMSSYLYKNNQCDNKSQPACFKLQGIEVETKEHGPAPRKPPAALLRGRHNKQIALGRQERQTSWEKDEIEPHNF